MARIALNSYTVGSESVSILRDAINEALSSNPARILRQQGSLFRGRSDDLVVNWGSAREIDSAVIGEATLLNNHTSVNNAGNKVTALELMQRHGVNTVEHTSDRAVAQQWVDDGHHVFVRTELRGHSGEGIICVAETRPEALGAVEYSDTLPTASLYTKGVTGLHREFRVHVFKGKIIFLQQKRRASGYSDNPSYSNIVRNHGNCWIYAHNNISTPNNSCLINAVKAVEALGLDFGAVDVLTHQNDAWVLEVNTAPGQTGQTTRQKYTAAFVSVFNGTEIESVIDVPAVAVGTPASILESSNVVLGIETNHADDINYALGANPAQVADTEEVQEMTTVTTYINVGIQELAIGDIVRIKPDTRYAVLGDDGNPQGVTGSVTHITGTAGMCVRVLWDNGRRNIYSFSDLQKQVTTEQPVDAPSYTIWTRSTADNLHVSDVVKIARSSEYYGEDESNPADVLGTVTHLNPNSTDHNIEVRWDNGQNNSYNYRDLMVQQTRTVVEETTDVPSAPAAPVAEPTPTPAANSDIVLTDKGFYKAFVNGTLTVVQYEASIESFYMVGFDMPLSKNDVSVQEVIDL